MPPSSRQKQLQSLLNASRPALLRRATNMLRQSSGAEDATQDAMVAALSHLDAFRGDAKLGTWLYRVGTNAVLMTLRHDRRMLERTKRAAEQATDDVGWLHGSRFALPPTLIQGEEESELLHEAVDHLPDRYRKVVILCDFNERPLEEVAKMLGLTVGGVRTRRLRAHRMLKEALLHSLK